MKYDCKPALNTAIENYLWLVFVNHEPTSKSTHSKPPPFESPLVLCSSAPCIFVRHFESSNDVCKMPV